MKEEGRAVYYHGYPVRLYQGRCAMLLENEKKSALEVKGQAVICKNQYDQH